MGACKLNNTTLVGRLTRDVDLRYTGTGKAVGNFSLAIERNYTNANGERATDFINCVIWNEKAENLAQFAVKGSLIGITGSIQTRSYENKNQQNVQVTEVVAANFYLLEPKSVTDKRRNNAHGGNQAQGQVNNQSNYQNSTQSNFSGNQGGFNQNNNIGNFDSNHDPFENNPDITDIDDSDLPF